jgi:NAD(P)-dependent dehydrogenase (short-subunit alcohol dehydrogenase family)
VLTARRADRLHAIVAAASGRGIPVVGDVRVAADCRRLVREAVEALGHIDLLVYCAGAAPLRRLTDTTEEDWATVLDTHVVGLHHVIAAAVGHLVPGGIVAALSSETVGRPRFGLGAYSASKAALEESIRAWRLEHPRQRFVTVGVGATFPTEFGDGFDPELLGHAISEWTKQGLMTESMLDPNDVAGTLIGILATALAFPGVSLEHLVVRPASPIAEQFEDPR